MRALLITGALAALGGGLAGWTVKDAFADRAALKLVVEQQKAMQTALVETASRVASATAISTKSGEETAVAQERIRTVYRDILKEVPVYVSESSDAGCVVPTGFVRAHDRAATGAAAVPDPAAPANDAPSGLALSAVTGAVVENYGTCRAEMDRLARLQQWIRDQQAEWAKTSTP